MNIYLVKRFGKVYYDECAGFVIRANSEKDARKLAADNKADENENTWLDNDKSICELIGTALDNTPSIVLVSFRPG